MKLKDEKQQPQPVGSQSEMPVAVVWRRATDRLRAGHLWVYRTDVERFLGKVEAGGLVTVVDSRRLPLGTALFSASSQITLRMVSVEAGVTRSQYLADVRSRLLGAFALRDELAPGSDENDACRLVFSEADDLPGIVVDRYGDLAVVQLLIQGTARDDVREVLAKVLAGRPELRMAVERPDARVRELEQLDLPPSGALFSREEETQVPFGNDNQERQERRQEKEEQQHGLGAASVFTINGLRFNFDAGAGQKTGAFLDQRLNYAAAAGDAHGEALDVCTYQGGFALHLARRCERVTGVDASRAALEVADRNLALNPHLRGTVDWIEADAFELLREFEAAGRRYDTIVLDPPAFAKSKRATEGALRGYKELNLRALKMLRPGGHLVTCSCSHHVPPEEFTAVVASAASDAGRSVQVLETRGAAPDHPAILTMPETSYLKCLICRVR